MSASSEKNGKGRKPINVRLENTFDEDTIEALEEKYERLQKEAKGLTPKSPEALRNQKKRSRNRILVNRVETRMKNRMKTPKDEVSIEDLLD